MVSSCGLVEQVLNLMRAFC